MKSYQVTITALDGAAILTHKSNGGQVIDLSRESAGVYLVRINVAGVMPTRSNTLNRN